MLNGKEFGKAIETAIALKLRSGAVSTKTAIAKHFNVKLPSIADWIKKGSISKDKLPELWRYFSDVVGPEHWGLSAGEWPSGLSSETSSIPLPDTKTTGHKIPIHTDDSFQVPLLANSGSMGDGVAQLDGDMVIGAMTLQVGWASKHLPHVLPGNLRFIHGYGDSMKPTFTDGDILLVDSGALAPDIDGVYVLAVNGKIYIKRITRRFNGQHEISSDNERVKTVEVLNGDHMVEIKGRVVWAWKGDRL